MCSLKLTVIFFIVASSILMCESQLTFTPNWGKRGISQQNMGLTNSASGIGFENNNCKTSVDSVMLIYRLIEVNLIICLYLLLIIVYNFNLYFID